LPSRYILANATKKVEALIEEGGRVQSIPISKKTCIVKVLPENAKFYRDRLRSGQALSRPNIFELATEAFQWLLNIELDPYAPLSAQ
jgi:hypothetical protein